MHGRWTWPEPMTHNTSVIITPSIAIIIGVAENGENTVRTELYRNRLRENTVRTELHRNRLRALWGSAFDCWKAFQVWGRRVYFCVRDFRLLPRCTLDSLFRDVMLRRLIVMYRRFGTIFLECLTHEAGTDSLCRNVTSNLR
jgi:hypothetical protein